MPEAEEDVGPSGHKHIVQLVWDFSRKELAQIQWPN